MPEHIDQFEILLEESRRFCEGVGLNRDLVLTILKTDSDWAFILKIDALNETAAKHLVRHGLRIQLKKRTFQNDTLDDFVDSLPMNGRTSLLKLLEAACLPEEELRFLEITRLVRNAFAHNIENAEVSLIDLIRRRQDRSRIIKHLSGIESYDEAELIALYEKDPRFFRFGVINCAMRFLFYAYHLAVKHLHASRRRRPSTAARNK